MLPKILIATALSVSAVVIDEKTGISVGSLAVIIGAALWVVREIKGLQDTSKALLDFQTKVDKKMDQAQEWREHVQSTLVTFNSTIKSLPCVQCVYFDPIKKITVMPVPPLEKDNQ